MNLIVDMIKDLLVSIKNKTLHKDYNALDVSKRNDIVKKIQDTNMERTVFFNIAIIIFLIFDLIKNICYDNNWNMKNSVYYIIIILCTIFYLNIFNYAMSYKKYKLYPFLYLTFWSLSIIIIMLSIYYHDGKLSIIPHILFLICFCNIPVLSIKEVTILAFQELIFIILMLFNENMNRAVIVELAIITLCCFIFSIINYNRNLRGFVEKMILEQKNEDLQELALTDSLTGLLNRRGLEEKIELLWSYTMREKQNAAIIMVDIDYFKSYNDRFGHVEGDRCLREVANAIKRGAKRKTDVIARIGGEEFLVFAHQLDGEKALKLAKSIKKNIEEINLSSGNQCEDEHITASIGISVMSPKDDNTFNELYDKADCQLYQAKETGRNCIFMNHELC